MTPDGFKHFMANENPNFIPWTPDYKVVKHEQVILPGRQIGLIVDIDFLVGPGENIGYCLIGYCLIGYCLIG